MKDRSSSRRVLPVLIACALTIPHYAGAQSTAAATDTTAPLSAAQQRHFTQEQLDRILAPIALYPDGLLAQVLTASRYPSEVLEASRWCEAHPGMTPAELQTAIGDEPWDPSVKSLCAFPLVLDRMARDAAWTEEIGNAFAVEQPQVMDAIQGLRRRARDAATLVSSAEQIVTDSDGIITIAPRNTELVYVPTYDPTIVYGPWWWPGPPYYPVWWAPPGHLAWYWGAGFGVGLGFWGAVDWHRHWVYPGHAAFRGEFARAPFHEAPGRTFGAQHFGGERFGGERFGGGFHGGGRR